MLPNASRLLLRLCITLSCILLVAVGLDRTPLPRSGEPAPLASLGMSPATVSSSGPTPRPPDALMARPASGYLAPTPAPSATPAPPPPPQWVKSIVPLRPITSTADLARHNGEIPQDSYLKVIDARDGRLLVHYSGDGDKHPTAEAWVNATDVSPISPPGWVATRRGTAFLSGAGADGSILAWLLQGTVVQLVEGTGRWLRLFYLGDGRTREAAVGWVDSNDLTAAGAMVKSESRGMRVLSRSDVESLRSGDGLWLKVPYRSQLDGGPSASANCGPSSVSMTLEFFGLSVMTAELRALANQLQGTNDPDSGVAIEHLESMVRRHGLRGEGLYAGSDFRRWSLEDVRRHLKLGHPVIPQLRYRLMPGRSESDYAYDHYVVLTGMIGDDFIYNDSVDADGPGYGRLMDSATLARAWGASAFPFAGFAVAQR